MTSPLPQRLRALLAAKRLHFKPEGASADCYAILATAERLRDLELAASELERMQALADVESVTIEGAGLQLLTHAQVREAALAELAEWGVEKRRDSTEAGVAIIDLCRRLGVEL